MTTTATATHYLIDALWMTLCGADPDQTATTADATETTCPACREHLHKQGHI